MSSADSHNHPAHPDHDHRDHELIETAPAAASGPLAGDPSTLGLIMFVPGGVSLGLALTGYTASTPTQGFFSGTDVFLFVTGLGLLIAAIWALALGQTAVAAIFGIFAGFWISLGIQLTGLIHNWFGIMPEDKVLQTYLIAFIVAFGVLTVGTLRLPMAFTAIFALVVAALAFVLAGVSQASDTSLNIAGYIVFVFTAIVIYVLAGGLSLATGGPAFNLGKAVIS
ncbi:MAG: hypothetical protein H0T85_07865 [Geodermatophilaceae bacterium]|nr:hypothetical protein [Geodermatophilaceae bacterium]